MRYRGLIVVLLLLVFVLVGGGIALAAWQVVDLAQSGDLRWRVLAADRVVAEETQEQRFPVAGPASLTVENDVGDVVVTGGPGSEIVVTARKRAWAPSETEAQAALATMHVVITQEGSSFTVAVEKPSKVVVLGSSRTDEVKFTIAVPDQTAVTAKTRSGQLVLSATAGDAVLETTAGAIDVRDQVGALTATSSMGAITARNVQGTDRVVSLASRFGRIAYQGGAAAALHVESQNGAIDLSDLSIGDSVSVDTRFGGVTLRQVDASSYDLSTQNGAVRVEGPTGKLKIRGGFGNVVVKEAENVDLDVETNNGAIDFEGSLGGGPHSAITRFGAIRLALPSQSTLNVDLATSFGQLESEFPITVTNAREKSHWVGTIGGGGSSLTAATRNGGLKLETLNR